MVSAAGGQPVRLTWHPGADVVQGWTPGGDVLFRSGREGVPTRLWRFYTVPTAGGLPTAVEAPQAYHGEMSADGGWLDDLDGTHADLSVLTPHAGIL